MPEVKAPDRTVGFGEKLFWTGIVLVVYLIMTEIPLFGVRTSGTTDPFFYMRMIFASARGTLMELGIQPIVTSGMILQLLAGSGVINVDFSNTDDRAIFSSATKFFSLLMTGFLAIVYLGGGYYGQISLPISIVIFLQLMFAGALIILLDELLQKGWGIGSGMSLFIAAGVSQRIIWNIFCPIPDLRAGGDQMSWGALIAYIQLLLSGANPLNSFITRSLPDAPTMLGLLATIAVFVIVIYLQGLRVEIPISHARFRGFRGRHPVKFFYVSNIPVILVTSLFMDIYFVSQIITSRFNPDGTNFFLNLLGRFDGGTPIGGLSYYITAPTTFTAFLADPLRGLIYALLMILCSVIFSVIWVEVGGLGPDAVAKQLVDAGMQIPGFRRSQRTIKQILERYISTVTILGALTVGAIAAVANFFGVFGTGMGVLLTVGILYQYYEILVKEQLMSTYPMLGRVFGE